MARRYILGNPAFLMRAARHAIGWRARRFASADRLKRLLDIGVAGSVRTSSALADLSRGRVRARRRFVPQTPVRPGLGR
jgi:hypothetical protein